VASRAWDLLEEAVVFLARRVARICAVLAFAVVAPSGAALNGCGRSPRPLETPRAPRTATTDTIIEGRLDIVSASGGQDEYALVDNKGTRFLLLDSMGQVNALGPSARVPGTRARVTGTLVSDARGRPMVQLKAISVIR
jgi:hypothetical protein